MISIFVSADVASCCYLEEAALWLAVGRLPDIMHLYDDGGDEDSRRKPDALVYRGKPSDLWYGFSASELDCLDIETDFDRYISTREYPGMKTGDEHRAELRDLIERLKGSAWEGHDRQDETAISRIDEEAEDLDFAASVEELAAPAIDVARSQIFQALAAGTLQAVGWLCNLEGEPGDELVPIPRSAWAFRRIDWYQSRLQAPGQGYFGNAQIDTESLMHVFPRPLGKPVALRGEGFGGCVILELEGGAHSTAPDTHRKRSRGRPLKGELSVKDLVLNYFGERVGRVSEGEKREALITEAMAFVEKVSRHTVGRSTVQGWFAQQRQRMPENMPVKRAGK